VDFLFYVLIEVTLQCFASMVKALTVRMTEVRLMLVVVNVKIIGNGRERRCLGST
jgi:hypothetical protein